MHLYIPCHGKRVDGDGARLYPHPPNDGLYQKWRMEETGDEDWPVKFRHIQSGKMLGGNATAAYLWPWDPPNQSRDALYRHSLIVAYFPS